MSKAVCDSQEEDDSFNIQLWRQNRNKTQPIYHEPQKKSAELLDGKKTVKYSEDPVMEQLMKSIMRESDKYPEDQEAQLDPLEEVKEVKPNLVFGTVADAHLCSPDEK